MLASLFTCRSLFTVKLLLTTKLVLVKVVPVKVKSLSSCNSPLVPTKTTLPEVKSVNVY